MIKFLFPPKNGELWTWVRQSVNLKPSRHLIQLKWKNTKRWKINLGRKPALKCWLTMWRGSILFLPFYVFQCQVVFVSILFNPKTLICFIGNVLKVKMSSYTFFSLFFTGMRDGKKDKEKKERENLEKEETHSWNSGIVFWLASA